MSTIIFTNLITVSSKFVSFLNRCFRNKIENGRHVNLRDRYFRGKVENRLYVNLRDRRFRNKIENVTWTLEIHENGHSGIFDSYTAVIIRMRTNLSSSLFKNCSTTKFWWEGGEARDTVLVGYLYNFCFYEDAQDTAFTAKYYVTGVYIIPKLEINKTK